MYEMGKCQKPLARILTRGVLPEQPGLPLFGGCYFIATGQDPGREQAFTAGIFHKLVSEQNYVSWSAEALADDAACHRLARIGYLVVGTFWRWC
jgi:hypothetical protein